MGTPRSRCLLHSILHNTYSVLLRRNKLHTEYTLYLLKQVQMVEEQELVVVVVQEQVVVVQELVVVVVVVVQEQVVQEQGTLECYTVWTHPSL